MTNEEQIDNILTAAAKQLAEVPGFEKALLIADARNGPACAKGHAVVITNISSDSWISYVLDNMPVADADCTLFN